MAKEKDRIVSLQKQLRIARAAMTRMDHEPVISDALDEMNRIEWASKPNLVQERVR